MPCDKETEYISLSMVSIEEEELGETNRKFELDRTHRIRTIRADKNKTRPIIVKFSRYNLRGKVFKNNKKLKGKGYSITESLTALRMKEAY